VCRKPAEVAQSAGIPARAEHLRDVPAPLSNKSAGFTRAH
jgi:hypothetical protein